MGDEFVAAALEDWRGAPLSERQKAAFAFLDALIPSASALTRDDVDAARAAGLSNQALEELALVCFGFTVMNRVLDAFGIDAWPEDVARRRARLAGIAYRVAGRGGA